jgi:hypothetical protein
MEFNDALLAFKRAADNLNDAWKDGEAIHLNEYPDYLPSFDEFNADVQAMERAA